MSHNARSLSDTGWPSPGRSADKAAGVPSAITMVTTPARISRVDMFDVPFGVDCPTRNDVHVAHRERSHWDIHLRCAALGEHLFTSRLNIAGFVPGAAL